MMMERRGISFDAELIRAAYAVLERPAPLNAREITERDARWAKNRVGNVIRESEADQRQATAVALGAWKREMRRRCLTIEPELVDACIDAVYAMKRKGGALGYEIGLRKGEWHEGLAELKATHPGFPDDLYQRTLRSGVTSSYW